MVLRLPKEKAKNAGLRSLSTKKEMDDALKMLSIRTKPRRVMWSRRAQEYETKINSGHIILLAEVLRDLTRDIEDGERSYSERIIYETAVHRLASEYSIIYGITFEEAKEKVIVVAKDKLNSEGKVTQKDEFDDEFDLESKNSELDEEESEDEDEDEDEDEEEDEDYDDDEKPKKRSKK